MAGDELIEQVEIGLGDTIELDDPAILDHQARLGVRWRVEGHQPERGIRLEIGRAHV